MAFNETTIADAIKAIGNNQYVLPAIQREFVWEEDRVCQLFDSLMQDFPVGQLLFWQINEEQVGKYRFYRFVRYYHERDGFRCAEYDPPHTYAPLTGVLDGQQRLTALNIGLRGSMSMKKPYKRWSSSDAFPEKILHLHLTGEEKNGVDGAVYEFKFLEPGPAVESKGWFPVPKIMDMRAGPPLLKWVTDKGVQGEDIHPAYERLDRLHRVIHVEKPLAYFTETSQDLDRVLQIFIRVNSRGMVLSYSDLLLSIATAQWTQRDARDEINRLVDDINRTGSGYSFSKDFILKAGLMLLDVQSVGFRVDNFGQENMVLMESHWNEIRDALLLSVRLISEMGYDDATLRADSALLPIAYYVYHRKLDDRYLSSTADKADRTEIKEWLARSFLKASGIWGSGLDTLLTALRSTIKEHGSSGFPVQELEHAMIRRGRSLKFNDEEIDELLEIPYGNKRVLPLLTLLYPFVDMRHNIHVDHVYPRSKFKERLLRRQGLDEETIQYMLRWCDSIGNLQLLDSTPNQEKSATMPASWLEDAYPNPSDRWAYSDRHMLKIRDEDGNHVQPTDSLENFPDFHAARHAQLKSRLTSLIGG